MFPLLPFIIVIFAGVLTGGQTNHHHREERRKFKSAVLDRGEYFTVFLFGKFSHH
jgi:hypothetical protein